MSRGRAVPKPDVVEVVPSVAKASHPSLAATSASNRR
jgi:hypothetical protein